MYRALITLSLLLVAGTSAYMAVYGLKSVFVSSAIVIVCMGVGMETGKVLIVSYLYRQWRKLNMFTRTIYIIIVSILVILTSIEIIGFLSQSHMSSTRDLRITETALDSLRNEATILKDQMTIIEHTLAGLPTSFVSRRINERRVAGYNKKQARLIEISKQQAQLAVKIINDWECAGPLFAVVQIMGVNETDAAAAFILLLVLVLEPLSIGLTIAASAVWAKPETTSDIKSHRHTPKQGQAEELKALCGKYDLTVSQLADITERKKQKTCEEWLNGTTQIPVRALRDVRSWAKEKDLESARTGKIVPMAQK
jgi:hypothetical protein